MKKLKKIQHTIKIKRFEKKIVLIKICETVRRSKLKTVRPAFVSVPFQVLLVRTCQSTESLTHDATTIITAMYLSSQ